MSLRAAIARTVSVIAGAPASCASNNANNANNNNNRPRPRVDD